MSRLACLPLSLFVLATLCHAETNWPRWRGPDGDGLTQETDLPTIWSKNSVVWKTNLKGFGQSSPIVWGEKIFLTSALNEGAERLVLCLDRKSGEVLWEQTAWTGKPEATHKMNYWASATCATDGERVVAFFGKGGIHCYDLDGKKLWSRDLGQFAGPWGTAASPVIVGDLVIQNCDADDSAFLVGLNKQTGEVAWKTERPVVRGWSTPILVKSGDRTELVVNGHTGVTGYDPTTGKELWFCKGDNGRGTPTVVPYKNTVIAVSGRPGDMFAVRPGGTGEVTASRGVWRTKRGGGRDLPSPIVVGDYLFVVRLKPGIATCYNAETGKELSELRLNGNFSSSPIAANGLVYATNETGETFVIKPGEKMEVVARNELYTEDTEIFRASLTPHNGQLLYRSDHILYCIGKTSE